MATFNDDSTTNSKVARKIKQVQFIPEPTLETYLNPIAPNLYRTPQIQEQQIPVEQTVDEFTKIGTRIKQLKKSEKLLEETAEEVRKKQRADESDTSYIKKFTKYGPGAVQLIGALASQDIGGIARSVARLTKDHVQETRRTAAEEAANNRRDLAEAKRVVAELNKKVAKKRTKTTHKGHKVDVTF